MNVCSRRIASWLILAAFNVLEAAKPYCRTLKDRSCQNGHMINSASMLNATIDECCKKCGQVSKCVAWMWSESNGCKIADVCGYTPPLPLSGHVLGFPPIVSCSENFELDDGNYCYHKFCGQYALHQVTAKVMCRNIGGKLPELKDKAEMDVFLTFLRGQAPYSVTSAWLGMEPIDGIPTKSKQRWWWPISKQTVDPAIWSPGEPNMAKAPAACGMAYSHDSKYLVADDRCDRKPGSVVTLCQDARMDKGCCNDEFNLTDGKYCYRTLGGRYQIPWSKANDECLKAGGRLPELNNKLELLNFIRLSESQLPYGIKRVWLGFTAKDLIPTTDKSKFFWTNSGPVAADLWHPGQPNKEQEPAACGILWLYEADTLGVNDNRCNQNPSLVLTICQREC